MKKPFGFVKQLLLIMITGFIVAGTVTAQSPNIVKDSRGKPNWVDRPDSAYSKNYYISAVGIGTNRAQAEANAFANLTGYFGQTVRSEIAAVETYKEQVLNGKVDISSSTNASQLVQTSASMDQLIGAEINDTWQDGGNYYAVAVMEKQKCAALYQDMITANLRLIETVEKADKASFEAIGYYNLAADIADANRVFATVLLLLGGPNLGSGMKTGDDYRYEAANAAKQIPVFVVVQNDRNSRIKNAFSQVLQEAGFRTGNDRSRYVLEVGLTLEPQEMPASQKNKFTRYVLQANLTDTAGNVILFPYSAGDRSGHVTQQQADERAVQEAERKIKAEYGKALSDYLAGT
jgi:hypothetical protein